MADRYAGKVALVTGAAAGIGKAVVARLASEGAVIVGVDRNAEKLAEAMAEAGGSSGLARTCDVADVQEVDATVASAIERFGAIDVLVNCAGLADRSQRRLHEVSPDDWERIQAVNVRGTFLMMRAAIPHMLAKGGGAIINMGSVGSFRATVRASAYVTSKGAVLMMTKAAAVDYARDGIRVNAVCPGTTNTDILAGLSDEMMQMLEARAPQGRLGQPEEIAALVAFLGSDEALHINGGAYLIDGGRTAGG